MGVRCNTLRCLLNPLFVKKTGVFLLLLWLCPIVNQAQTSLEDVKKEANKLFEDDAFTQAYKLYSQLVANFPKDPEYNYRLGVCMIYSEPDKKKCIPYLKAAAANPKDTPKDVNFYLGKAYHINYLFDEAIKCYTAFKSTASASQQKKLQVDREISACNNGKRLLSNLSDLVVQNKKTLNEADYFRSYDLKSIGGKLLVKPDEFKTAVDKKKKEKSVVFLPKNSNVVYFSSYGENTDNGKDIYTAAKISGGGFSKPEKVKNINTEFDEDYPFLHPDGKTLYFASKGHNSMGGYDIFKTVFIEESGTWSKPENLEFPINSPDDDFLFVTDSLEKTAYFSTGRQSAPGKIDVLKINTDRKPIDVLVIKGTVVKESAEQSLKSVVSVKNMADDKAVGTFEAQDNGDYTMDLPNGAKLLFTVETPGLKTQSEEISLPLATTSKPFKQTIAYENGILKIINQFDENAGDDNYLQYLKVIEKKAKLDVNEGENKLSTTVSPTLAANETPEKTENTDSPKKPKTENRPQVVSEEPGIAPVAAQTPTKDNAPNKESLSNKQLAQMAIQDAEEALQESKQMENDAADALETGNKQKEAADKKLAEANEAIKTAESITNEEEKKNVLSKANELKRSAESDLVVAEKILDFARSLEKDAKVKKEESELNKQYASELQKNASAKNKAESLAKIQALEQQINSKTSVKPESEAVVSEIKTKLETKESELASVEKINNSVKANLEEIKTEITTNENELKQTKKKAQKAELAAKIEELKADKDAKEKQIITNDADIARITEDINTLKNQIELTSRIKTEEIAISTPVKPAAETQSLTNIQPAPESTTATAISATKITPNSLKQKYKGKTEVSDNTNKLALEESVMQLKAYNADIDIALADNQKQQARIKSQQGKLKLAAEAKELNAAKKQNQQQITTHTNKIQEINARSIAANAPAADLKEVYEPLAATTASDAVTKLSQLENKLAFNDNDNFDFNGYQNPKAQALKVEADARINDAVARQKKLKDEIAGSKTDIGNLKTTPESAPIAPALSKESAELLSKEADDLHNQSLEKIKQAKTAEGAQKEQLLSESRQLEDKANEKHIELAEVNKQENAAGFNLNKENIDNLIKDNKSPEADLSEAKRLSDEAQTAFKKAQEIRAEVISQTSSGAKLGILSNAEEKEAEAILMQQQSIDILKKSNPDFALKTSASSATASTNQGKETVDDKLATVNKGLNELAAIKVESYQKLQEANNSEISDLENQVKEKQSVLDSNPALKSEYVAAGNKLEAAKKLNQEAETANTPGEKLAKLVAAVKKQNDAVKQLNKLNSLMALIPAAASASQTPKPNETEVSNQTPAVIQNTNAVVSATTAEAVDNNNVAETTTPEKTKPETEVKQPGRTDLPLANTATPAPATASETSNTSANNGNTTQPELSANEMAELSKNDTTSANVIQYLNESTPALKNTQASNMLQKSINQLKNYEADVNSIEAKLKKTDSAPETATTEATSENSAVMKTKSDELMVEADAISTKAIQARKESQNKEGAEKEALLTTAKELETQALDKNIEAATLLFLSNEIDAASNSAAIDELLGKMRNDNPELSVDLAAKRDELVSMKGQIQKLRAEAEDQTNKAAKLGAINNAEERELELLQKQEQLLTELKKQYPDYVVKQLTTAELNATKPGESKESLLARKKDIRTKQYAELTNLTNAFSLEFESQKNNVPKKPDAEQQKTKQKALALNEESKRLLIKSAQEKNDSEKMKLLSQAARLGSEAVSELDKIALKIAEPALSANNKPENKAVNELEAIGKQINEANTNTQKTTTPDVTKATPVQNAKPVITKNTKPGGKTQVRIEGLEVRQGNAYTAERPIPINAKIEDGLVFRVQIGAFKTQLPNDAFKGLNPLNGETTANGYFRYTAGNFNKIENANAVKNDLRGLGYSDAFVVAYYNGKRVSLAEALELLNKEGKTIDPNAPQTAGITANVNVPKASANPAVATEKAVVSKELEKVNGLLYTIQIGVYNRQVSAQQLRYLKPIFTEQLPSGLFRYTAGIYNNTEKVVTDKRRVVEIGVKDAFVSAYLNGKKIPFGEAKDKQANDASIKLETEDPIIFPNGETPANLTTPGLPVTTPAPAIQPFSNGVSGYPATTADNGVKQTEDGISFKVQIGAYSKQVPNDVAAKFQAIKTWPVENKQANGLFIYNIGNFSELKFAQALKEEVKKLGINDAFITVYKDGKKLYGAEQAGYMNR